MQNKLLTIVLHDQLWCKCVERELSDRARAKKLQGCVALDVVAAARVWKARSKLDQEKLQARQPQLQLCICMA